MRKIEAPETSLQELLDEIEQGETVLIIRDGRPVARIVPEPEQVRSRADVFREIKAFREGIRPTGITIEEILAWRQEGHGS